MTDAPDIYDRMGEGFARRVFGSTYNRLYDQPTVRSLTPPLDGATVLDVACGPGAYFDWLVGEGASVIATDASAEVVGTMVSRTQLQRWGFRADRRGEVFNVEAHLAGDIDRADLRLERLTKVAGWAGAAGEDVAAIDGYLAEASSRLDVANGSGSVEHRHDAVHISLAWMTQAAAALDEL